MEGARGNRDHEQRLPSGGTNARTVSAVFHLYLQAVDSGLVELAPATVVTSRLRLHYDGRTDVGKRKAIAALELG